MRERGEGAWTNCAQSEGEGCGELDDGGDVERWGGGEGDADMEILIE